MVQNMKNAIGGYEIGSHELAHRLEESNLTEVSIQGIKAPLQLRSRLNTVPLQAAIEKMKQQ